MSGENEELRSELIALVEETRRHLIWMQDAGMKMVKRVGETPSASSPVRAPPPPSDRARPAFMGDPAPTRAPPRPLAPAPTAAPATAARPVAPLPPAPTTVLAKPAGVNRESLQVIRDDLGDCHRCKLAPTRTNIVFGYGNPAAEIVFVGEGPGEDEDREGVPFVGRSGQLLSKMIEAMGFTREQVYLTTVVKCVLPPKQRAAPDEIEKCRPFVERQLESIRPKVIVALGGTAAQALLRVNTPITQLRNTWHDWHGIPVMPTFHPDYLLQAPGEKGKAWDDLKLVLAKLGRGVPQKK